jgi:hypothetical protein
MSGSPALEADAIGAAARIAVSRTFAVLSTFQVNLHVQFQ